MRRWLVIALLVIIAVGGALPPAAGFVHHLRGTGQAPVAASHDAVPHHPAAADPVHVVHEDCGTAAADGQDRPVRMTSLDCLGACGMIHATLLPPAPGLSGAIVAEALAPAPAAAIHGRRAPPEPHPPRPTNAA